MGGRGIRGVLVRPHHTQASCSLGSLRSLVRQDINKPTSGLGGGPGIATFPLYILGLFPNRLISEFSVLTKAYPRNYLYLPSCGTLEAEEPMEQTKPKKRRVRNWLGIRTHHLTIVSREGSKKGKNYSTSLWKAVCDCGRERTISGKLLGMGSARTCGHRKCPYRKPSAIHNKNVWIRPQSAWNLTTQEFHALTIQDCHFCGVHGPNGVTLVNERLPYSLENVLPICHQCSKWKGKLGLEAFVERLKKVTTRVLKMMGAF